MTAYVAWRMIIFGPLAWRFNFILDYILIIFDAVAFVTFDILLLYFKSIKSTPKFELEK
jgi:hypothetical protein